MYALPELVHHLAVPAETLESQPAALWSSLEAQPKPAHTPYLVSRGMLLLSSQLSCVCAASCATLPAGGSPDSEWSVGAGLGLLLGVKLPRFSELMEAAWCWLGVWACESGGGGVRSREWFCRPPG